MVKQSIYLDHAAATPVSQKVIDAIQPYFAQKYYNPSATYLAAKAIRSDIDDARAKVAVVLGVRPAEVIFTAGGTEANNMAIKGIASQWPGLHIISTALEHGSVRYPILQVAENGMKYTELIPKIDGIIDVNSVLSSITDNTVLISVMYANNEIGTIQPIRELSKALQKIKDQRRKNGNKTPLYLHTDACQAANYLDLHVSRLGVDMMTLNGGKIYGPKQSGVLFVASHVQLTPLIHGGGQEYGKRSGTENITGIIGFANALLETQNMRHAEIDRLKKLQIQFIDLLQASQVGFIINGSIKNRLPNNVHITIPGQDNERLIFGLDELGVQAAAGSACSASSEESSHVLRAIGLSDDEARASLRFTMGRATSEDDIKKVVDAIVKVVA